MTVTQKLTSAVGHGFGEETTQFGYLWCLDGKGVTGLKLDTTRPR
jgi:hypothetical protein